MDKVPFLPTTKDEMFQRGWPQCDVIFVTADAYCDHPSFGVALLSRFLEAQGYRVGIIAQPDWRHDADFLRLGPPRLFFGVTAGNLDSMLNIYTAQRNLRRSDKYSPGGRPGLRPKLPTIVYTNKLKQLFGGVPVVIGGLEASLRRLAHYDFWTDKVKRSILFDAKADILVYGMGERPLCEISGRLNKGGSVGQLKDIRGTVVAAADTSFVKNPAELPSFEEVAGDKKAFVRAFKLYSNHLNPYTARPLIQRTGLSFCVQNPPALPLSQKEMDEIYGMHFTRRCHPRYDRFGGVPALATVETSLVSHRGCGANCSFCSLSLHQGRVIQSRSARSIVHEAKAIAGEEKFKGAISDVGGPTANMYAASCAINHRCSKKDCLWPTLCKNFVLGAREGVGLLRALRAVAGIRQVYIQSGVRYDLLLLPEAKEYFKELCQHHVSGQLKIAPEHVCDDVLQLMHKPPFETYEKFLKNYQELNSKLGKKQYLAQYFITSHPGCSEKEAKALARFTKTLGYTPEQIQDFIPLPMTRSSVMYHAGLDPETGKPVYVPRGNAERQHQRRLIQGRQGALSDFLD